MEESEGKRKDVFAFSGGGPGSQSEAEQPVRQRQVPQWSPERPTIREPLLGPGNRQRNA